MAEIKKLVKETLIGKPEDEKQIFEKCLNLVGSNRSPKDQELGFLLLSRMIIKSSPQTLRALQSRLANRFAQISDHFRLSGCLFVREVLVRNPQAGELHAATVFKIILNSIDAATQSMDPIHRGLAAELFGLRVNNQTLTALLNTLDVLLSGNHKNTTSNDILQLRTLGVNSHRDSLTSLLFEILALSLGYSTKSGLFIERNDLIRIIEMGIRNPNSRSVAFAALRSVCVNMKFSFMPMIGRIVSTLISELESPDVDLMKTLAFISRIYGPITSTIHKHFYVIFTSLKQPIHELEYGSHVADLLANIIESGAGLIKPEVFVTVQKAVCESSVMHPDSSIYLQLVAAFLALNNEYVPSPLQVARTISARTRSKCEHAHRLKALCNVASRPRITDLANVRAKKTLLLTEETTIQATKESTPDDVEDDSEDVTIIEEEPEDVVVVEEPPIPETTSSRKKKTSESAPVAVVPKKKKVVQRDVVETNLLEGEASVDDILNLFDMS